jgi:hypothetical protein
MKRFIALSILLFSHLSYAISDEDLAATCLETGKAKIAQQAEAWNCNVNLNQTEVQTVDNRDYNPSKYVWYQVITPCNGYDRVIKLVQYHEGTCF